MARKAKRKPARRAPARQPAGQAPGATAGPARSPAPARVGGDQALVRAVEMSLAPRPPAKRGGRVVLDSADPAIPLDRVPYFTSDLKRLGIAAVVMVALLVAGAQLIPLVVR